MPHTCASEPYSVNYEQENKKLLTELNTNTESVHANPDNLNFYLAETGLIKLNFKIIKKKTINSHFGEIELAIIGDSHYFMLQNYFIEIMTCSEENYTGNNLLFSEAKKTDFRLVHKFDTFRYSFSVKTENFSDTQKFLQFEKELLNKEGIFAHAFHEKTAITALQFTDSKNTFSLATWHTYPEYRKVIGSESVLKCF